MVDASCEQEEVKIKVKACNNKVITVRLPIDKREALKKLADERGISCNEMCRQALLKLLEDV
jgi:hypothetical protein